MDIEGLNNPHDKFFKESFSRKEVARSFLREYLPERLYRQFDFKSLEILKDSFIDKELSEHFSDILYKIKIAGKISYIYLLFEHKSYADNWYAFQILRNRVKIWENFCKQHKKAQKLPVIVPIVIYHGEGKWQLKNSIAPLFEAVAGAEKYIPDSECEIFDISHMPDEEIRGEILLRVQFLALKYIFKPDLIGKVHEIIELLFTLSQKKRATEYLETLLRYFTASVESDKIEDLGVAVKKAIDKGKGDKIMLTIAEKWVREGEEKGKREGIKEGIKEGETKGEIKGERKKEREICRKCIALGMQNEQISSIVGLEIAEIEKIRGSSKK